jgi:hypothetical protein
MIPVKLSSGTWINLAEVVSIQDTRDGIEIKLSNGNYHIESDPKQLANWKAYREQKSKTSFLT